MGASDQPSPMTTGEQRRDDLLEYGAVQHDRSVPGATVLADDVRPGREATYADFLGEQVED